ncbi:MAG: PhzF family phenazine biosynthesis protein [Desulfobacteraceae bacterium]|nr:PhzF family phenazine biosynthesis protein [Desulfobacteraceae bacterium]
MKLPLSQVDAFTGRLFTGNPAAVVLCESELSAETMRRNGVKPKSLSENERFFARSRKARILTARIH